MPNTYLSPNVAYGFTPSPFTPYPMPNTSQGLGFSQQPAPSNAGSGSGRSATDTAPAMGGMFVKVGWVAQGGDRGLPVGVGSVEDG